MTHGPEDQPLSLEQLLAGTNLSGLRDGLWQVGADSGNVPGQKEKYRLSSGLTEVGLLINADKASLVWDATIPDYMSPGQGRLKFSEFLQWALVRLPSGFYPSGRSNTELRRVYQEDTEIDLIFDDKVGTYKLGTEEGMADLVLDFVRPQEPIRRSRVRASNTAGSNSYTLDIRYADSLNDTPTMSLAFPLNLQTGKAFTPYAMQWVLGANKNIPPKEKTGDMAKDLSAAIGFRITEAVTNGPFYGYPIR